MNEYECYTTYMALKRHFTSDYDIFKYRGKVNNTEKSRFDVRKDKYFFYKLSKLKDPRSFMLANIVNDPNFFPGDVKNMTCHAVYTNWQKRRQSMGYTFRSEIAKMHEKYDDNLLVKESHPYLMRLVLRGDVCLETFIILNKLTPFFQYWNKKLEGDMIWNDLRLKAVKYEPFLDVDLYKYKQYTMEHFE
tara:strand:+ start:6734 stop:7303 length:570 start_codon:yes stop_codon:yes gene_type:complete